LIRKSENKKRIFFIRFNQSKSRDILAKHVDDCTLTWMMKIHTTMKETDAATVKCWKKRLSVRGVTCHDHTATKLTLMIHVAKKTLHCCSSNLSLEIHKMISLATTAHPAPHVGYAAGHGKRC
jgi:hypothetical protein